MSSAVSKAIERVGGLNGLFFFLFLGFVSLWATWLGLFVFIIIISKYLFSRYQFGVLTSTVISLICASALVAILSFLIDFIFPTEKQFIWINFTLIVISLFFLDMRHLKFEWSSLLPERDEILSTILAIGATGFLLFPAIQTNGVSEFIRFLSSGEDHASHFAMFQRNISKQSPPYFDSSNTGLIQSLNIYPQGIHSFSAFFSWSILGERSFSPGGLLKLYYLMNVAVAVILTFIISRIIQLHTKNRLGIVAAIAGSTLIFIGSTIFLTGWGFAAQIAALAYLACFYYLVLLEGGKKEKVNSHHSLIFVLGILAVGITFSWYLLLPVAFVVAFPLLKQIVKRLDLRAYVLLCTLALCILAPILLNILTGKGSSAINEPGGVYRYGILAYGTIGIAIGVLIYLLQKRQTKSLELQTSLLIIAAYLMPVFIAAYQLFTIHRLEYYYYKSLYLPLIISIIIITVAGSYIVSRLFHKISTIVLSLTLVFVFVGFIMVAKPVYPAVYFNNWFNHLLLPQTMLDAVDLRVKQTYTDVIFISPCDTTREYIANRWAGALFLSESIQRNHLETSRFYGNLDKNIVQHYMSSHPKATTITQTCL